ncbi:DUF2232 domain-containing protein [Bacillus canaveralius]|uniref:DUF2232 domain-containing protein n=1 Tax=Bacillus canaveralius TaxID=1403243 RepID=A0A2N5GGX4_9BACI|nr:YybS family protein [Bacillus canaveralius]PLR79982.1 DUF2232 domain-containing protein [Bacillus canaveralius]PLR89971.1 DUF2232 domain-containing protein [Bacillus canaveralius]RSK52144.1 DUF2232 domain-containing protein [Bacillus canaveralius]
MKNVYNLTQGAVFLAIYTVLLLITLYVPVIGTVINYFLPLPFILFSAKHELKSSAVFLVASILLSFIVGSFFGISLTLGFGLTGLITGYLIKKQKSRVVIFIAASFVFLLNLIVQYVVAVILFQINFIEELMTILRQSVDMSIKMLTSFGQEPDGRVIERFESGIDMIETLMPSLFVLFSFLSVFLIHLISMPIVQRLGLTPPKWKPLRELVLPKSLLWYYLFALIASLLIRPEEGTYWYWALANLVYILQFFMILQGISFVFFISYVKGYSKAIPIFVTILACLFPFVLYIVRILGIIDIGFNLRQRLIK